MTHRPAKNSRTPISDSRAGLLQGLAVVDHHRQHHGQLPVATKPAAGAMRHHDREGAGEGGCAEIAHQGRTKLDFLRRLPSFENGVPSHDTLDVVNALPADEFPDCFVAWVGRREDRAGPRGSADGVGRIRNRLEGLLRREPR